MTHIQPIPAMQNKLRPETILILQQYPLGFIQLRSNEIRVPLAVKPNGTPTMVRFCKAETSRELRRSLILLLVELRRQGIEARVVNETKLEILGMQPWKQQLITFQTSVTDDGDSEKLYREVMGKAQSDTGRILEIALEDPEYEDLLHD